MSKFSCSCLSGGSGGSTNPFSVAGFTSGSSIDLLPSGGAPANLTITGVQCGAVNGVAQLDVKNNGATVTSIMFDGITGDPVTTAASLANTAVNAGDQVTAEVSGGAGTAFAFVFFNFS